MTDDKKEDKEDLGSRTVDFMNMMHDNSKTDADRAMALQKLMFENTMQMIDKMSAVKETILAEMVVGLKTLEDAIETALKEADVDVRKRDKEQHEKRGELATALSGDDLENKKEEFADVMAWLCTLANINGVDMDEVCTKYSESEPTGFK